MCIAIWSVRRIYKHVFSLVQTVRRFIHVTEPEIIIKTNSTAQADVRVEENLPETFAVIDSLPMATD